MGHSLTRSLTHSLCLSVLFFWFCFFCPGKLTEERDLWGSAAYTLAMKVTDKHTLNTAKTLHLCEKAWARLTRHFAIFLSEKDSIQVTISMTSPFYCVCVTLCACANPLSLSLSSSSSSYCLIICKSFYSWSL